jgi:hypothetical protein
MSQGRQCWKFLGVLIENGTSNRLIMADLPFVASESGSFPVRTAGIDLILFG